LTQQLLWPLLVQVHEKSILLPLLPITMLAASEPDLAIWGPVVGVFQMYPLLVRDGAAMAYIATNALYLILLTGLVPKGVQAYSVGSTTWRLAAAAALCGAVLLHVLELTVSPPASLAWLWDRLFVTYGFVFIAAAMVYLNFRQWHLSPASSAAGKKKAQ
jgi:alpha-1,3-glucosyltransferase